MFKMVNPDGGEFGTSRFVVDIGLFGAAIFKYAHWLSDINALVDKHRIENMRPSYCFNVGIEDKKKAEAIILSMERLLPKGVEFYKIDGRVMFEVRGPGGGIVSEYVCYLMGTGKEVKM